MGVNPTSFSTTPGSNTTIGSVNAAEQNPVKNQNNIDRALAASIKELILTTGGALTLAGSSNTYTVTTPYGLTEFIDGITVVAEINATNTGAATLNVDAVGALPIKKLVAGVETALAAGDLVQGNREIFQYDASLNSGSGAFVALFASLTGRYASTANGNGASLIGIEDAAGLITGTTVEAALAEIMGGGVLHWATKQPTTSGTAFDFTGIPSWAKLIIMSLVGVSLSGVDNLLVQLGYSGGIETSGYLGTSMNMNATPTVSTASSTAGFPVLLGYEPSVTSGHVILMKHDGNLWSYSSVTKTNVNSLGWGAGDKTISGGALDRVRLTRTGSNTFDAGSVNIGYM